MSECWAKAYSENEPDCDEVKRLRAALERSVVAIDDWLHQYAGELCDENHVEESAKRIGAFGTVGYIADVQKQNREALGR